MNNIESQGSSQSDVEIISIGDESDYECTSATVGFIQPLSKPSNASQPGKHWFRNPNNTQFIGDKLFTKSDYFRHKIACQNGHHPTVEIMVDGEFQRQIYKWEF